MTVERLRVASYNVHGFVGGDGRRDVDRVADVIEELDADVVALQEVDSRRYRPQGRHPLSRLAEQCGSTPVAGPTLSHPEGDYGNALLLRWRARAVQRHDLSVLRREPRGVVVARLVLPGGAEIAAAATHLGLRRRERRWQADRLCEIVDGLPAGLPAVLLGDLNLWAPWSLTLRRLARALRPTPPRRTFPARLPILPLDRVLVRPGTLLRGCQVHRTRVARLASDHLPLVAELEVPAGQSPSSVSP